MQKLRQELSALPTRAGERLEHAIEAARSAAYYVLVLSLTASLLAFVSAFMYGTLYFAFVPSPSHRGAVFPVFEPCVETPGA